MTTTSLKLSQQLEHKPVKGYEELYYVSSDGDVISLKRGKILKPQIRRNYYSVSLSKNNKWRSYPIHRLVAEAFIPNPNNYPQVNHKNSNKLDNRAENLEWCTVSENKLHSYRAGTSVPTKGILNGMHTVNRERRLCKTM